MALAVTGVLAIGCGGDSKSSARDSGDGSDQGGASGASGGTSGASAGDSSGGAASGAGSLGGAGAGGGGAFGGGSGQGPGGAGGANNAGSSGVTEPDVRGTWAMFVFEDPVAVDLAQNGNALSGWGCCAGLNSDPSFPCCGPIQNGRIENARASFSFPLGIVAESYAAEVHVARTGDRMAGTFYALGGSTGTTAWVRIPPDAQWLTHDDAALRAAVTARQSEYALVVADGDGSDVTASQEYRLVLRGGSLPLLFGDLGPFWAGEMTWLESESTLEVGPVPPTAPELPIALRLRFAGDVLMTCEATFASGSTYVLEPN
jgi:hypothetical protein